jgi:mono/diheme cytochrome c family protein
MAGFTHDPELEASTNRWMLAGVVVLAGLVLAFPLYRVWEPGSRNAAHETQRASLAEQGGELWSQNCAACHGVDGEGVSAPALNSEQFLRSATDDQAQSLVAVGVPGTAMSAWSQDFGGPLTTEQITAVVSFVRSWEEDAPDRPDWREPSPATTTTTAA